MARSGSKWAYDRAATSFAAEEPHWKHAMSQKGQREPEKYFRCKKLVTFYRIARKKAVANGGCGTYSEISALNSTDQPNK